MGVGSVGGGEGGGGTERSRVPNISMSQWTSDNMALKESQHDLDYDTKVKPIFHEDEHLR